MRMDNETIQRQAEELVAQMTVEEAASQLRYDAPAIERLGVPAYNWWSEALHGVARAGTATMFPQAVGMAAMFDDELLEKVAGVIGTEARAKYNEASKQGDRDIYKGLTLWSPNINIFRDPRWGRGHETYGEDPYLTSRLGVAFVKGLQGDGRYLLSAACAKHFAVHSGPESIRHSFDAQCGMKDMYETYLPAFEALVKEANVEGVMGAYNRVNGEAACASSFLMDRLKEWGFNGYFVSDCWAIRDFHTNHMVTATAEESAALALKRGCDCNCGNTYLNMMSAYEQGLVTEEDIRKACVHLMRTRIRLGMFDDECEYNDFGWDEIATDVNRELSRDCAEKSMVLLKNDGVLPVDPKKLLSVAVIGPNADSIDALRGNYYGTSQHTTTFLEGIREALDGVIVRYAEGSPVCGDNLQPLSQGEADGIAEAVSLAQRSDLVVLCVGLNATIEGEEGDTGNSFVGGDKTTLDLPDCQKKLVDAVLATGKPVVLVLAAGSSINPRAEQANAIIQAWYPGEAGGEALARILFGEVSPSGKLPVTFYESVDALPDFTDYSMKNRTYRYAEGNILYPFGYGLTYSKTEVSGLAFDGEGAVKVTVANTGKAAVEDVVEIYVRDLKSADEVKNYRLCAFKRVALKAGESRELEIKLDTNAFTVVTENGSRVKGSGSYRLWAGTCQPDALSEKLSGTKCVSIDIEG